MVCERGNGGIHRRRQLKAKVWGGLVCFTVGGPVLFELDCFMRAAVRMELFTVV